MISRQAPGRKDVVVIRGMNGEKSKVQARHLTTSINEVYAMFKEANPNIKIGRSKFADMRPKYVLLSKSVTTQCMSLQIPRELYYGCEYP